MPRARVVLATYNQGPFLQLVLRAYFRQTSTDFSLCVADDGSSDGTREIVEAAMPDAEQRGIELSYVWQADQGFRKARILNEALRRAGDEQLLVFSDADCLPRATFVAEHLEQHEARSFHVGGVAWLTKDETRRLDAAAVDAGLFETWVSDDARKDLNEKLRKSRVGMALRRPNRPKVLGANMAFDRSLLEAVNGFDEAYEGWGYEDSDLRTRAMAMRPRPRVKLMFLSSIVFHLHPLWRRKSANRTVNREYYRRKKPARCVRGLVQDPD